MKTLSLEHGRLRSLLHFDAQTGEFTWLERRGRVYPGDVAGNTRPDGYRYIKIDDVLYRTSRLAVFYMRGFWPAEHVDHINGNTSDDRWSNLREVTRSQNQANRRPVNKNGSHKGVFKRGERYRVHISCEKRRYHLGSYGTKDEARSIYWAAAEILFGDYARPIDVHVDEAVRGSVRELLQKEKRPTQRPVRCMDTGKTFASITHAAEYVGSDVSGVWAAIRRGGTSAGLRFEYAE